MKDEMEAFPSEDDLTSLPEEDDALREYRKRANDLDNITNQEAAILLAFGWMFED